MVLLKNYLLSPHAAKQMMSQSLEIRKVDMEKQTEIEQWSLTQLKQLRGLFLQKWMQVL